MIEFLRTTAKRIAAFLRKDAAESELDAELQTHLDLLTAENIRRGMSPNEARCAACREFGGVEQTKELYRDQRGLPILESLSQDVRFAVRMLVKNPAFTLVTLLTLALGIGATSSVFSVVDRLLFRSLPYPHSEQLVSFGDKAPFESSEFVLGPDYLDWRDEQTAFSSLTSLDPGTRDCDLTERNPVRLACAAVDATFLPTFEVQPYLGRNFTPQEDRPGAASVAVLSYAYWTSRFGRDRAIVGKSVSLDNHETRIIGVLPAGFELPTLSRFDLLVPEQLDQSRDRGPNARQAILRVFGRMRSSVSISQAAAAMQPLFQDSLQFVPPQFRKEVSFQVRSLRDRQVGDSRTASWLLLGSVLAVLLVACTNVANLFLARAANRRRELAVRKALGASRIRLARQALTESLLLGLLGGVAGCAFAYLLIRVFVSIAPEGIPRLEQASVDFRVLLFTLAVSLLAGIFFGLAPALQQPPPLALTGKDIRATTRGVLRQILVTAQIAASLILLAGAGLVLRSLWNLETVPLGMNTESAIIAHVALGPSHYPQTAQQLAFFNELESRLRSTPGISSVAISDSLPPSGRSQATFLSSIEIPGRPKFTQGTGGMIGWRIVTPQYFRALGIPVTRGRAFEEADRSSPDLPVILSESLAKRLLPNEDPLGKMMRFGYDGPWRTIVGVAGDVKNDGLAEPAAPEFYMLWKQDAQGFYRSAYITLRAYGSPAALPQWIRSRVADIDPTLPVEIESMSSRISKLAARPRFDALLLTLFAALGALLAAIGIYGVVGFLVLHRTQEIGVRMALGATPYKVLRLVLASVARWAIAGTTLGLLGAWFGARSLQSLLFGVQIHDLLLFGLAVAGIFCIALGAAWIPARRAMRVDPMIALRYE